MNQEVKYREIQDAMSSGSIFGSAAEAHGLLSGMLCMDLGTGPDQWLHDFFGAELGEIGGEDRSRLDRLFEQTRAQLEEFDFSFNPLLPDDDETLEVRAFALGEWCHGFLQGIGYNGKSSDWPGECSEILRDLLEIVKLDTQMVSEAEEAAYYELTEYVRVGVQVIQTELQGSTSQQRH